jgi:hypothetical protein
MPDPSRPCGRATPETVLRPFQGWPAFWAGGLRPSSTPLDTPCCNSFPSTPPDSGPLSPSCLAPGFLVSQLPGPLVSWPYAPWPLGSLVPWFIGILSPRAPAPIPSGSITLGLLPPWSSGALALWPLHSRPQ